MPWPVPAPGVISARAAALFEQSIAGIDARSDNTVATTLTRITELSAQDLYFMQGYLAQQLMPDTATDWLPLHGAEWGVPQAQPTPAGGNVLVTGPAGSPIPAGVVFSAPSQALYTSIAPVTLSAAGTGSLPVVANVAGSAGNLPAGTPMVVVSPVAGLAPQSGVLDANGATGGLDLESVSSWRARILAQIRTQPSGGNYNDYIAWIEAALPGAIGVCPASACGGGSVNVAFVMPGPSVPSAEEIAVVLAYIQSQAPVTAQPNITVNPVTLQPVNFSLQVRPNTVTIQNAALAALALYFQQSAAIGGTIYMSDVDEALAGADGEQYHERLAPLADVVAPSLFTLLTLGTVTFS
ncbi:MAG: hypothetical protein B7Z57_11615 [Acidiphilium sp. 37-60-79]|nr:MAG: hypothetical protein B7Z57_11615 [Acidiphilium sp. 37-60-79]OZB40862.1 MAG: hypothetical protein B7X48_03285 [Acidiphilium sp. 34-60-192]